MQALLWRQKMRVAPKLRHSDGLVLVDLGGKSVLFPTEEDARFFYHAYTDIVSTADAVDVLRLQIDEEALSGARERVKQLEADVERLSKDKAHLERALSHEVSRRTEATRRATLLAKALRSVRK